MDFTNRNARPFTPDQPSGVPTAVNNNEPKKNKKIKFKKPSRKTGLLYFILFLVAALIVAFLVTFAKSGEEGQNVDKKSMQAIFLNNGQVYFGRIAYMNSSYVKLNDIYYLRVNQQVQPGQQVNQNDVSLAKLGCELHGPKDVMMINRDQITFWENLKDNGQVAKAVAEYIKANPNGQNCEQQNTPPSSSNNPAPNDKTPNGTTSANTTPSAAPTNSENKPATNAPTPTTPAPTR